MALMQWYERQQLIAARWAANIPGTVIARELGITDSRVYQLIHQMGLPPRARRTRRASESFDLSRMDVPAFWAKVAKGDGCWEWQGPRHPFGYGVLRVAGLSTLTTHRIAWILENGPIPAGMVVMHRCDNPPCVRPGHLAIGTQADNLRDMRSKGRGRGVASQAA